MDLIDLTGESHGYVERYRAKELVYSSFLAEFQVSLIPNYVFHDATELVREIGAHTKTANITIPGLHWDGLETTSGTRCV